MPQLVQLVQYIVQVQGDNLNVHVSPYEYSQYW